MYEHITDAQPWLDQLERSYGTSHAEQAAHLAEDTTDLDEFNAEAVAEIIEYVEERWTDDATAMYAANRGHEIIRQLERS